MFKFPDPSCTSHYWVTSTALSDQITWLNKTSKKEQTPEQVDCGEPGAGVFNVRIHIYLDRHNSRRIWLAAIPGKHNNITKPQKTHVIKSTLPDLMTKLKYIFSGKDTRVTLFPSVETNQ